MKTGQADKTFSSDVNIEAFIEDFRNELRREIRQHPAPNPTLAQLTAEVGHLADSMVGIGEGNSADWLIVWQDAKRVAAMAARCVLEGDPSLGAVPTEENTKE